MLTQQQVNHFETFGFIVWREAFSPDEIASISQQFDDVLAEDRHGNGFAGDKRQGVLGFLEQRKGLSELVEDDRIYTSVEQLLGPSSCGSDQTATCTLATPAGTLTTGSRTAV